jgi:hypothetical protein
MMPRALRPACQRPRSIVFLTLDHPGWALDGVGRRTGDPGGGSDTSDLSLIDNNLIQSYACANVLILSQAYTEKLLMQNSRSKHTASYDQVPY